ncbi:MAG TPA: cupin domain-containing protein [Terriglobales bacterium]|nr:cupin domain-containing protein [Terriglobales bacterium]
MPIVDTSHLREIERLPGWRGRYVHSETMTFAHYAFDAGASIHEHSHPEEEVYEVLEGELEMRIAENLHLVRPGLVAIVPANARHSVRAVTSGRVIVVDHPARPEFG